MQCGRSLSITAVLLMALAGCSQSGSDQAGAGGASGEQGGADKAVLKFLAAVKAGDQDLASQMLTPVARKKTAEMNLALPAASDTASYKVGEVEMVDDGAHVASEWTDTDEEGNPHTDTVVWILRREAEGWRVAGMATKVFEDELPIILNFEDPEDMLRKQKLAEEEMVRRQADEAKSQARQEAPETTAPAAVEAAPASPAAPAARVNRLR